MIELVDYSFSRPSPAGLLAAGIKGVCRYLAYSHPAAGAERKFLTIAELADLHSHGLSVVANFESTAGRALVAGAAGGTADGTDARVAMSGLGFPVGRTVYVSIDVGTTAGQYPSIATYFRAFQAALVGKYRIGFYGGSTLWSWLVAHGFDGMPLWQAAALSWSGGRWEPRAAIQQYHNGVVLAGGTVDRDRSLVADYGQWDAPQLPDTSTEVAMPNYSVGGVRTGSVATGTPYYTEPGDATPRSKTTTTRRYLLTAVSADGKRVCLDGRYDQAISAT